MILLIDNYDSFTYNLVDYFAQLNQECIVVKNDQPLKQGIIFDSIVLSPGPGSPKDAGGLLTILKSHYQGTPILGICLGHQAICEFFGGTIKKAIKPMHGKISNITRTEDVLFQGTPEHFKVVRYHSLVCSKLPETLMKLATTEDGELMAVRHKSFPIWGIQFHPEAALTEFGILMLENWLKATGQRN